VAEELKGAAALKALEKTGRLWATTPEAAAVMERDIRTVRAALQRGEIPHTKVGVRYQIPVAWLRRAAEGRAA
jgi:excisionase family DNA binding protein